MLLKFCNFIVFGNNKFMIFTFFVICYLLSLIFLKILSNVIYIFDLNIKLVLLHFILEIELTKNTLLKLLKN